MSIRDRVVEAQILYQAGQFDGAFLLAAVAVAGTAKRRYPEKTPSVRHPGNEMGDGERFESFLGREYGKAMGWSIECGPGGPIAVTYQGKRVTLVHVIYKFMRCELAHSAKLPDDIKLVWQEGEGFIATGDPSTGEPFKLTTDWVLLLLKVVVTAPENRDLFPVT